MSAPILRRRPLWARLLHAPRTFTRHYRITPDARLAARLTSLTLRDA